LARYGLAARHLGRFNGAYLAGQALPDYPWLTTSFLREWWTARLRHRASLPAAYARDFGGDSDEDRLARTLFAGPHAERLRRLADDEEAFFGALARLPKTLSHLDAHKRNLFARGGGAPGARGSRDSGDTEETVAIDWSYVGAGVVGEDPAELVVASLVMLEADAGDAAALDAVAFPAYLQGLRDSGWHGDERAVRLGYAASAVVRWALFVAAVTARNVLAGREGAARAERQWGRPNRDVLRQWVATTMLLLDLADEARAPGQRETGSHAPKPSRVRSKQRE
jgi:hypothetical protein